jgi:hypothetical protein
LGRDTCSACSHSLHFCGKATGPSCDLRLLARPNHIKLASTGPTFSCIHRSQVYCFKDKEEKLSFLNAFVFIVIYDCAPDHAAPTGTVTECSTVLFLNPMSRNGGEQKNPALRRDFKKRTCLSNLKLRGVCNLQHQIYANGQPKL